MSLQKQNAALLLIDIQDGFKTEDFWGGNRNNKDAEQKAAKLLQSWRALKLPIFHIIHGSTNPDSLLHPSKDGFKIQKVVEPLESEPVIVKNVNSGFIGTDLQARLDSQNINTLVIVGLTTNHCISTTARMAGNFGYTTYVVSDATGTFDRKGLNEEIFPSELIHQTALANLNEEFATILITDAIIELL